MTLHNDITNIPCVPIEGTDLEVLAFRLGHEQAILAAASLAASIKNDRRISTRDRRLEQKLENSADIVAIAMRKAWQLGQTYWQQADSDSYKHNNRSEDTRQGFLRLVEETRAAITGVEVEQ